MKTRKSPDECGVGADWNSVACDAGDLSFELSEGTGWISRTCEEADSCSPVFEEAGSGSGFGFRSSSGVVGRAAGSDKIPT
jgi:hypothetical protein